jgi:PAS domain S-box-containing protein
MSTPLRVLVVEDSEDDALLVVRQLREGGYDVTWERVETSGGLNAALGRGSWDLVISDYSMPHFSGPAALNEIQNRGLDLPFIIVSGTIGEDVAVAAMKAGVHDYLMKRNLARLVPAVERELHEAAVRRDRQRIEADLIASEVRYRRLFESAKDGILILNGETGKVLDVNPMLIEKLGFSREQFLGRRIWELGFFKEIVADQASFAEMQRKECIRHEYVPLETPNGRRIDAEFVSGVFSLNGRKVIQCNIRDITERRLAEETLRREQALFANLANTIPDQIYFKDRQSRFIRINDATARKLVLHDASEAVGKTDFNFFSEEQAREFYAEEQQIMETGEPMIGMEEKVIWSDGRVTWSSTTKMPLRDAQGGITGLVGINRDITERKLAEVQLREQNEILSNSHEGTMIVDMADKITLWNHAAEKIIGWTQREVLGRDPIDVLCVENRDAVYAMRTAVARDGFWNGELRVNTRDGRKMTLNYRVTFVRDDSDRPRGRLNYFADITEKRLLEEQLLRAQRLESIGMLAGGIAHDLNNILAPMLMAAGLLKEKLTEPREKTILAMIEQGAQRGAAIIRQLLTFSRGIEGPKGNVQIRHLIDEMGNIARETFPRSIEVGAKAPADLWVVKANPNQLHQVLMNLCVNARDAMPNGGRLSLTAANTRLVEEQANLNPMAKPGRYVVMTVADTGDGIPKEVIGHIFEPFFTTKGAGKGTGIGLSTVTAIVKNHGGFVTAYSEPTKGSQFKVYLPVDDELKAEPEKTAATAPHGHGERVLLVDDEAPIRESIRQMLEAHGYRVVTAANGAEALRVFVQHRDAVQLVLTDLMMPVLDGAHMIRSLRILDPKVRVVAMSGLDSALLREDFDVLGVQELVAKPCDAIELLQAMQRALATA